jgi:hypothetical protein
MASLTEKRKELRDDRATFRFVFDLSVETFCRERPMKKAKIEIVQYDDGLKDWYRDGKIHRDGGPAVEYPNNRKEWWREGELHRKDGPAVEQADGGAMWYRNGKLHRDGGPAIERADGSSAWYRDGNLHREDGPAFEDADGHKTWALNGKRLTKTKFKRIQRKAPNKTATAFSNVAAKLDELSREVKELRETLAANVGGEWFTVHTTTPEPLFADNLVKSKAKSNPPAPQ